MLSIASIYMTLKHVCDHEQDHNLHYRNTRDLSTQKREIKSELCSDCANQLSNWMGMTVDHEPFPAALRPLSGSEKQVVWANTIRERNWTALAPIMVYLCHEKGNLARATLKAMVILFSVTDSRFWIALDKYSPARLPLNSTIAYVLKPLLVFATDNGQCAYQHMKHEAPANLKILCSIDPAQMYFDLKASQQKKASN